MADTTTLGIGGEALSSLVSRFVMAAIGFGGTVVFARVLGASGLGIYKTALAVAFVGTQLSSGIGTAIKKRVSEVDAEPGEYLSTGIISHIGFSAFILVALLLASERATAYFGAWELVLGVGLVIATVGMFNVVNSMYAGLGYPARSIWADTLRSALTLICQIALLWVGLEAFGLILGLATGTIGATVFSWAVSGVWPRLPEREHFKRVFEFARWSIPNGLLTNLYSSADIIIITAVAGSAATGLYTVANQLVMPAAFLASSISQALFVKASGRFSADKGFSADLINSVAYSGLFAVPILFGALAMPRAIPRTIFGGEFATAGTALVGMALFQVASVYASPFEQIFGSIDRPDVVFRVNVGITIFHLPVAVFLGSYYGLIGVITASAAAEWVRLVTYQSLSYLEFGRVVVPRPVLEHVASGIGMFVILEGALTTIVVKNWIVLLAVVGGGAAIYFGILFVISPHFRLTLGHALPVDFPILGGK